MIRKLVILGGGSAGFTAALTLARKVPDLQIRVVRSPEIGVIGVGEGTTAAFPRHFFNYLGLDAREFYQTVRPTWKLGVRFLWGPGGDFHYTFGSDFVKQVDGLKRKPGFYLGDESVWHGPTSALLIKGKVFARKPDGGPDLQGIHAFHIENDHLVAYLEGTARALGVEVTDGRVTAVRTGAVEIGGREERGVLGLSLESGEEVEADLFVDASGFRSELLAGALGVGRVSYDDSLFCDRAVIGGWARSDEPIPAYTTAEAMDHGWAWQIEHREWINRGYVYSSSFVSDEEAEAELRRKNPKLTGATRVVRFSSSRVERMWAGNVVGIGNASGFVEPLEATALQVIGVQCSTLADVLADSGCDPTPSLMEHYNRYNCQQWDDVRDFLAIHYRYNSRSQTPFWQACRSDVKLWGAEEIVQSYRENGPSTLLEGMVIHPANSFRFQGYLSMLVGQQVPHARNHVPSAAEVEIWRRQYDDWGRMADRALDTRETLEAFQRAGWS